MQDNPKAEELLLAMQDFLMKEIMPAVRHDKALSYKTLVSWNMLGVVARELQMEEGMVERELESLLKLHSMEDHAATGEKLSAKKSLIGQLNTGLVSRIRKEKILPDGGEVHRHVRQTLEDKLSVSNPRFSRR